jgi:hypothetical protein
MIDAEPARQVGGTPRARGRAHPYPRRFAVVYAALALIAGVGVGAFVIQATRPDSPPPPAWSAWEPTGSDIAQARQIADQVGKRYRLPDGQQMVAAIVSPPKISTAEGDVPVSTIAIRPDTSTGKKEESAVDVIPASDSLQYDLCGLGPGCSIATGEASDARHALLRREALELALYTFKYVDGIDSVSVFLPPPPDNTAPRPTSVFLKKGDLSAQLGAPLTSSIAPRTPAVGTMSDKETELVDRLTLPRLYSFDVQQAQDGSAVIVYDPIVLGT